MISPDLSKKILSVGPEFEPPKGGIAQIIKNYSNDIFPDNYFNYISNSCDGNRIKKLCKLIFSLIKYVATLAFNRQIEIVHIHTASRFSFKRSSWFAGLAKLFRKKIILHVHGGGFKNYYASHASFVRRTLGKCDVVVVLTDAWASWFKSEVGIDNLIVVPNVIPEPSKCEAVIKGDKFHVLFLGLINDLKGIFDLLDAINRNKERLKDRFELHVAGNGEVERLKSEIQNSHLGDLVKYEGWVDSSRKHKLLCCCDTLILPSYIEGLPLSILEAMSYRIPVISTPVGGIPSMIDDGVNGFLVEPGDGDEFIAKILYLIENRIACQRMGDASLDRIKSHFPQSVAIILNNLYKKVLM